MKKILLCLVFTVTAFAIFAANTKTPVKKTNDTKTGVLKEKTTNAKKVEKNAKTLEYNCQTSLSTVDGACWSAGFEVTVCSDADPAVNKVEATVIAENLRRKNEASLIDLVTALDDISGC
jgi:hypothetical protein